MANFSKKEDILPVILPEIHDIETAHQSSRLNFEIIKTIPHGILPDDDSQNEKDNQK